MDRTFVCVAVCVLVFGYTVLYLNTHWAPKQYPRGWNRRVDTPEEDIDIVYTWVDGEDPVWKKKRDAVRARVSPQTLDVDTDEPTNADNRYIQIEELRYSLRSVYTHMPWIRYIHIVVDDDQVPACVDCSHPKIRIVRHCDIFPDKTHLPTFNSQSIETHLHRIPGLANRFFYFNDDTFVGCPTTPDDFISPDGKPYFFYNWNTFIPHWYKFGSNKNVHQLCYRNNTCFIHSIHPKQRVFSQWHQPILLDKRVIQDIEDMYPDIFRRNSMYPFRSPDQFHITALVNVLSYEMGYKTLRYQLSNALFTRPTEFGMYNYTRLIMLLNRIYKDMPVFFCLNNFHGTSIYERLATRFLNAYFPDPCPYEVVSDSY